MKFVVMIFLIGTALVAQEPAKPAGSDPAAKTERVETPFGPTTRAADAKVKPRRPAVPDPRVRFEENGDTITFRRQTPFGDQVWRRKRSELSDAEKEMLAARASSGPAAAGSGAASAASSK